MRPLTPRAALTLAVVVLVAGLFFLQPSPSAAAVTLLSVSGSIDTFFEIDTYGISLQAGMIIQVEMVCGTPNTLDPSVGLFDPNDKLVALDDDSGLVDCGNWQSSLFTYVVPASGYYWLDATHSSRSTGPYTLTVTATGGPGAEFSGPGLPGPDGRNLVLFTRDTDVLSGPDGAPTGSVMKACQTAFIISAADEGAWGRMFVLGGWIPLANTLDVPEDYGQNSEKDAALVPGCVGVLPYPPVYQPPAAPTPTPIRPRRPV